MITGFVSGKGGVGKTSIVANVAVAAARNRRVLVVDGDLGLSSLDVFLGLKTERTIAHVLAGECELEDAIVEGPGGIHVLAAATARSDLTCLHPNALARLLVPLFEASLAYDLILVDVGPGVSPTVVSLALACDRLVLVTTPEPTSLADAYATLKIVTRERRDVEMQVVVNFVRDAQEARDAHARLSRVSRRFLELDPPLLCELVKDVRYEDAAKRQVPLVQAFPTATASRQLVRLADILQRHPQSRRPVAMETRAEV